MRLSTGKINVNSWIPNMRHSYAITKAFNHCILIYMNLICVNVIDKSTLMCSCSINNELMKNWMVLPQLRDYDRTNTDFTNICLRFELEVYIPDPNPTWTRPNPKSAFDFNFRVEIGFKVLVFKFSFGNKLCRMKFQVL